MLQSTHYQHSGTAPLGGILLTITSGLVAASILGAIYGFLIYWSPFVYINFFITLGFGIGLGTSVGGLAKLGKIRSISVVTGLALAIVLFAWYAHWVVWSRLITEVLVLNVATLSRLLATIADLGAWSIFSWTPTGFALWAIWGIEALMIVGIGTLGAAGVVDVPFCEDTGQWATDRKLDVRFSPLNEAAVPGSPASLLASLQPLNGDEAAFVEVTVATADGSDLRCVSLDNVVIETDKDGKQEAKSTCVVRHMLFDRDSFERLLRLSPDSVAA